MEKYSCDQTKIASRASDKHNTKTNTKNTNTNNIFSWLGLGKPTYERESRDCYLTICYPYMLPKESLESI